MMVWNMRSWKLAERPLAPNPTDAQMDELRQFLHELGLVL